MLTIEHISLHLQTHATDAKLRFVHDIRVVGAVDTGGLLQADWCTGVDVKLQILASLCCQPGKLTCVNGTPESIVPPSLQTGIFLLSPIRYLHQCAVWMSQIKKTA
jgi:hypothetical protein